MILLDFLYDFVQWILSLPVILFEAAVNFIVSILELLRIVDADANIAGPLIDILNEWSWLLPVHGIIAAGVGWLTLIMLARIIRWALASVPIVNW